MMTIEDINDVMSPTEVPANAKVAAGTTANGWTSEAIEDPFFSIRVVEEAGRVAAVVTATEHRSAWELSAEAGHKHRFDELLRNAVRPKR